MFQQCSMSCAENSPAKITVFLLLKSVYICTRHVPISVNVASRGTYYTEHFILDHVIVPSLQESAHYTPVHQYNSLTSDLIDSNTLLPPPGQFTTIN